MGAPLVLVFVVLLVYPVGQLLLLSVVSDGAITLAKYRQLFASSVYVDVTSITLKISLLTTVLSAVAGYPVAYLISSLQKDRKARWIFWVLLSFWTSFLVRAFAWVVMLGRNGVVNQLLTALGLQDTPTNLLYSLSAVLVGMVHALMPLAVLTMLSVMENIDRNLPRAALTLGARPGTAFWRVYFPLSMPRGRRRDHGFCHRTRLFHRAATSRRPQRNHDHAADHRAGAADAELGFRGVNLGVDARGGARRVRAVRQAARTVDDDRRIGARPSPRSDQRNDASHRRRRPDCVRCRQRPLDCIVPAPARLP